MSSTSRWGVREPTDYYVTPHSSIVRFLDAFLSDKNFMQPYPQEKIIRKEVRFLDPCAGGNIDHVPYESKKKWSMLLPPSGMAYPTVLKDYGYGENTLIDTNDIRENSPAKYHEDFINSSLFIWEEYDCVITNPPFSLAEECIRSALECVKEWGYVIMLLRLNFFGGKERWFWLKKNMPIACYVQWAPRMSFTPDGGADSIEYAHYVWRRWATNTTTELFLI